MEDDCFYGSVMVWLAVFIESFNTYMNYFNSSYVYNIKIVVAHSKQILNKSYRLKIQIINRCCTVIVYLKCLYFLIII